MYGLFSIRKHANDDLVEIVIKDSDSGRKSIVTLEVSLEKFARAAFGQAEVSFAGLR